MTTDILDFILFARRELRDVLLRSGAILYSSIGTLARGKYVIIGLNPGGSVGPSIQECLDKLSRYSDNAYMDEDWYSDTRKYGKGNHPLQRQLKIVADKLDFDLRSICATNLIFMRSPDQSGIHYPSDADICWKVNARIMQLVQPDVILAFGNSSRSPYDYLKRKHFEYHGKLQEEKPYPSGHGRWELRSFVGIFSGKETLVIGLPHLSRYSLAGRRDQLEWLKKTMTRMT